MRCQDFAVQVDLLLEDRASTLGRRILESHARGCEHCSAYLRQIRLTVGALRDLSVEERPPAEPAVATVLSKRPPGQRSLLRASVPVRIVGALERWLGGWKGWAVATLLAVGAAALALIVATLPGPAGPGRNCVLTEIASSLPAILLVLAFAMRTRLGMSTAVAMALAGLGAAGGFAYLYRACPMALVGSHVALFHVGGLVLAVALGAALSRLPATAD